jgi:hypothetical protein
MLEAREIVPASADQASLSVLRSLPTGRTVIKVEFAAEQFRRQKRKLYRSVRGCVRVGANCEVNGVYSSLLQPPSRRHGSRLRCAIDTFGAFLSEQVPSPVPVPDRRSLFIRIKPLRRSRSVANAAAATATKAPATTAACQVQGQEQKETGLDNRFFRLFLSPNSTCFLF